MSKLDLSVFEREPVRIYLYTVGAAILALLVGLGVINASASSLILGVLGAVLAIGGIELARSQVTPVAKVKATRRVVNDEPYAE